MAAGTVLSGGFPGRIAQEVQPNQKCNGCLHFNGQAGRTGACTIGLQPWLCGDGEAPQVSYAPIAHGAGGQLHDMSNHGAHAREVDPQPAASMYGAGSTKAVVFQDVTLGGEHAAIVKSVVASHDRLQKSQCRLCSSSNAIGTAPANVGVQRCSCQTISARDVAKALVPSMNNAQRAAFSLDELTEWVRAVAKAGFKTIEKGTFYVTHGKYEVTPAGGGSHHVDYHPKTGAGAKRVGTFGSPKSARRGAMEHSQRFAAGSPASGTHSSARFNTPGGGVDAKTKKITTTKSELSDFSGGHLQRRAVKALPVVSTAEAVDKSYFSEEWLAQFKGTSLFKEAHALCSKELEMEEAQLKRREERAKHDKEQRVALAKLDKPSSYDWEKEDAERSRVRLAKQRLALKLAELQSGSVSKSEGDDVEKAIDNEKHSHVVTGRLAGSGIGVTSRQSGSRKVDNLDKKYGASAHSVSRNPNFKPKTLKFEKHGGYGPGAQAAEAGHGRYVTQPEKNGGHNLTYMPHGQGEEGHLHGGWHATPAAAHTSAQEHHAKMIGG